MSSVSLRCPDCDKKLKIPRQALGKGKKLKCPNCGTAIKVTGAQRKKSAGPAAGQQPKRGGGSSKGAAVAGSSVLAEGEAEFFSDPDWNDDDLLLDGGLDDYPEEFGDDDFEDEFGGGHDPTRPPSLPRRRKPKPAAAETVEKEKQKELEPRSEAVAFLLQKKVLIPLVAFGLLGLGGVGFAVVMVVKAGKALGPPEVKAPERYAAFESKYGQIRCEYPEGWEASRSGGIGGAPLGVRFTLGNQAFVSIKESIIGSAVADIARAETQGGGGLGANNAQAETIPPVDVVHAIHGARKSEMMDNYEESNMGPIDSKFGEARISDYTASGTLGGEIYGCRATLLRGHEQYNVICECYDNEHFQILKPVFEHVVMSIE